MHSEVMLCKISHNYIFLRKLLAAVIMKSSIFWNITPCGPLKVIQCFGGIYRLLIQSLRIIQARNQCTLLAAHFHVGFCLVYSSTLKMESTFFFETSVDFQRTKGRNIAEGRTLHNDCCEKLKSYFSENSCLEDREKGEFLEDGR
jgi:hypothetical protein